MSSKVRMHLRHDETMSDDIRPFARMFLGEVTGIVLRKRGATDDHICFEVISEDDEYWFPYTRNGASSSFWFEDYQRVLAEAKKWCEEKALPSMHGEHQFGWQFKPGTKQHTGNDWKHKK